MLLALAALLMLAGEMHNRSKGRLSGIRVTCGNGCTDAELWAARRCEVEALRDMEARGGNRRSLMGRELALRLWKQCLRQQGLRHEACRLKEMDCLNPGELR